MRTRPKTLVSNCARTCSSGTVSIAPGLAVAGVVDQDADGAVLLLDGGDGRLHRGLVGHVERERAAARRLEVREGLGAAGGGVDGPAEAGEMAGGGRPDPRRAAGDQDGARGGSAGMAGAYAVPRRPPGAPRLGTDGPRRQAATGAASTAAACRARALPGTSSAIRPPSGEDGRADPQRGDEAVDERLRGLEAAGAGEHGREDRDAEHAAELADRVVGARRLPGLLRPDGAEHRVGGRGEDERHARAAHDERGDEQPVGDVGLRDQRDPDDRRRLQEQARAHQRARADPVGEDARDRGDQHRHARPGQRAQARPRAASTSAPSGRTAPAGRSRRRCRTSSRARRRWWRRRRASGRSASAASGRGCAARAATKPDEQDRAGGDRAGDLERAPAGGVAADDAVDTPSRPALASATPGRSSRCDGPWLSLSLRSASGTSTRPTGTLSQKIHCQLMPSITAPPTSGPSATPRPLTPDQMPSARPRFVGGGRGAQQREGERGDDRGAGALEGARGDQRAGGRREGGGRRGRR